MLTEGERTRLRRQMHRRIRVVLALRRVDAPVTVPAPRRDADQPAGPTAPAPRRHTDRAADHTSARAGSAEPAPEH